MLGRLFTSAKALETIDERLMRCGVSRRAFLQFCSTLMVAAPFGLAITDKKTPEEVAPGPGRFDPEHRLARVSRDVNGRFRQAGRRGARAGRGQVLRQVRLRGRRFNTHS